MDQTWYVVKTKPRHETQVALLLAERDVEAYLPLVRKPRDEHPGPLFPTYLFVRLDEQSNDFVRTRSAPGVAYFLSCDGQPSPVPATIVQAIRQGIEARGGVLRPTFRKGDRVRILAGPFAALEAVFDCALRPTGRSRVFISLLGRLTPVLIPVALLEKPAAEPLYALQPNQALTSA